jgi:hypothetical protein
MTLTHLITAQLPPAELQGLALVFNEELRNRLVAVQAEYGSQRFTAYPARLVDGRYMHQASILTECQPAGLYHAGFSHLDAARFSEIDVIDYADALALLPESPSPVS